VTGAGGGGAGRGGAGRGGASGGGAGRGGGPALPAGLRERVLSASLDARAAGRAWPLVPAITGAEAFTRAADAFDILLGALREEDWARPALRELDVQGLVGHLTGVEEDMHRAIARDPEVAMASHVGSTQPAADRQAGRSVAQTHAEWRRAADRTIELVRGLGDPAAELAVHGMRLPVDFLLIARAFELWVHEIDIRRAVGQPPAVPDESTLTLMTSSVAGMLPLAAALTGVHEPTSVHLVLTGAGGGTWDLSIGSGSDGSAATIVTDAIGFCRLVGNRAAPDDLELYITGDSGRAARVLAAASALALD
jgi:uncharacterized protein (TIGR03083 family)